RTAGRGGVARRSGPGAAPGQQRREGRRAVERTEAGPRAGDAPEPVERGAEEGARVLTRLHREPPQDVERLERMREDVPPAAVAVQPLTVREREHGGAEPERHRDRPREGEAEARMCLPAR